MADAGKIKGYKVIHTNKIDGFSKTPAKCFCCNSKKGATFKVGVSPIEVNSKKKLIGVCKWIGQWSDSDKEVQGEKRRVINVREICYYCFRYCICKGTKVKPRRQNIYDSANKFVYLKKNKK